MAPVLGLNARNAVIARSNPRRAIIRARDKLGTKERLAAAGVPVPPTIVSIASRSAARRLDTGLLTDGWVLKPARSSRGRGVLVATEATELGWTGPSGPIVEDRLLDHLTAVVDGAFSDEDSDVAMFEPWLSPHPAMALLSPSGLPDVRVVCEGDQPLLAMVRIPTLASGGRGNLHQGGVGAGVHLATGVIERATSCGIELTRHPDVGTDITGVAVPCWDEILAISARCAAATGLGYLGIDVVVADGVGPLVLEVNSHPGLEIQNVNRRPLRPDRR